MKAKQLYFITNFILVLIFTVSCAISFAINYEIDLFKKFSNLKRSLSYVSLCDLPTPIVKLEKFGDYIKCKNIYMKRDDLSGGKLISGLRLYGGNKPRKLEFLLADAVKKNKKSIITCGCVGSNHALATAVYANKLSLKPILMMLNQPNSSVVRHNLLLNNFYNAQLNFFSNRLLRDKAIEVILKNDQDAYFIPTGGSNSVGVIGFVNAAFELANQIKRGEIKEPDLIYIPIGSCGTLAGLLLGMKAAGLKSKVVGVTVFPEKKYGQFLSDIKALFKETNKLLHDLDLNFKIFEFPKDNLILNKRFCGTQYGLFTKETTNAVKLFKNLENINLESTYSAKPIAAIIDDNQKDLIEDQTILFWNTYCGLDFSYLLKFDDYKKLPKEFHRYFTNIL